jgi:DNA-binding transcriptional LysR family regulator
MLSSENQALLSSRASMTGVELRQLEHFVAVAEEASFTRAAARVHVGQSAMSVSIRTLERELGVTLFDRTTHQVAMTDAGAALLAEARRTLSSADAARDAVAAVRGVVRGALRVGVMQSMTVVDVASLLAQFHHRHPGVDIHLRPALGGSAALAEDIRHAGLDVGFISLPDRSPPGLSATVLASEPLLLVGAAGSLPPSRSAVALGALARETFVDFPVGWGTRAAVDRAFARAAIERRGTIEVADVSTFVALIRAGLGLGLLPRSMLPRDRRLVVRRVTPEPTWDVMMVRSTDHPPTAAARAFADLVDASVA